MPGRPTFFLALPHGTLTATLTAVPFVRRLPPRVGAVDAKPAAEVRDPISLVAFVGFRSLRRFPVRHELSLSQRPEYCQENLNKLLKSLVTAPAVSATYLETPFLRGWCGISLFSCKL